MVVSWRRENCEEKCVERERETESFSKNERLKEI